ncbi:hypothetical protein [Mycetocola sp. JXN-3]|uniref:hypothetical protein n=1 Tax=Mycetocola sp. JXN-3 TaxID=2116510 RepID=UPI00165CF280|nr:hypothetical protein [Mycetocola sp. JXN-3]
MHRSSSLLELAAVAAVGAGVLGLFGCAAHTTPDTGGARLSGSAPAFSGPWAEEFRSAWNDTGSQLERDILADEIITEQELVAAREPFVECLAARGVVNTFDEIGGGETTSLNGELSPDEQADIFQECTDQVDDEVDLLYWQIKRNPENLDEATIMAKYLVDKGIVERGFSAKDYERDFYGDFPFSDTDMVAGECLTNPLGVEY